MTYKEPIYRLLSAAFILTERAALTYTSIFVYGTSSRRGVNFSDPICLDVGLLI